MSAEATVTPIWKKQKLFVAVFLFAISAWFLWDGSVTYPRSNERWLAHAALVKSGHEEEWTTVAKSHGWTEKLPHKFYGQGDIRGQWVCSGLAAVLGLVALLYWLNHRNRVLRTDESAVYSPAGTRVPFESITGLGKKHWQTKGLATVLYMIEGRKGRFILDDYKFDRDGTHKILSEIEEKILARSGSQPAPPPAKHSSEQ